MIGTPCIEPDATESGRYRPAGSTVPEVDGWNIMGRSAGIMG
jgi:hypothetical protein